MPINEKKLDEAIVKSVAQLKKSERGQRVLKDFKALMDNGADNLDSENGAALCVLVIAAIKEGKRDFLNEL